MRYAALLHDFGKVGVREHVLVKAEKLYPHELELLRARFPKAQELLKEGVTRRKLAGLLTVEEIARAVERKKAAA